MSTSIPFTHLKKEKLCSLLLACQEIHESIRIHMIDSTGSYCEGDIVFTNSIYDTELNRTKIIAFLAGLLI